jgi:Universal stress protein UspA and related nucleotide-binding proteins
MHGQGLRATGVAVVGWNPADAILNVARPERVAVVALATHGRGGLRRLVLGSVADKLVRGADVPVLVYRPGVRQDEAAIHRPGRARGRVAARGSK